MGFLALSVSLEGRQRQSVNLCRGQPASCTIPARARSPLPLSLLLEGVLQPVQQLVAELTHILLQSKGHNQKSHVCLEVCTAMVLVWLLVHAGGPGPRGHRGRPTC